MLIWPLTSFDCNAIEFNREVNSKLSFVLLIIFNTINIPILLKYTYLLSLAFKIIDLVDIKPVEVLVEIISDILIECANIS